MRQLIARRLVVSVVVLVAVSFLVFAMVALIPGDPATILAGEDATPDRIEYVRQFLGLDQPLLVRYAHWLAGAAHGNLGNSAISGQKVTELLLGPIGVTCALVGITLVLSTVLGLFGGVLAASRPGSVFDRAVSTVASLSIAMPSFWVGLILVNLFAVQRHWLPAVGYTPFSADPVSWLQHLVLPALALGALPTAELSLQLKESLRTEMRKPYFEVGLSKGLSRTRVLLRHALKNASIPVVTVFGYRAGQLLGGAVAVETVFALPGLGSIAVASVLGRDVNVLLGMVVVTTLAVILINLLVDISYGYLNPKVRT